MHGVPPPLSLKCCAPIAQNNQSPTHWKENEEKWKCEALCIGKIRGAPKNLAIEKIKLPSNGIPMQHPHMVVRTLSNGNLIFLVTNTLSK